MKKISHIFIIPFLILSVILIHAESTIAQQENSDTTKKDSSMFNVLARENILHLYIKTNFKQLIKEKKKEEKLEGLLSYKNREGQEVEQNILLRTRGNMRKNICYYPPIKIYFPKKDLKEAGLQPKFNDYKIVLGCKSGKVAQNYVLKEYLIYKLYQEMTDLSFRVQLIHLTIQDLEGKQKTVESYGFIIENEDELAARINAEIFEPKILSPKTIEPSQYDLMTVFQFMVGNTDWYMYNKHNLKSFKFEKSLPITIPFDFDYAGLVGTGYAVPHEKLPIKSVEERFFLGRCRDEGVYESTLQLFRNKKEAILNTCSNFPYLDKQNRKAVLNYLEAFFEILDSSKRTKKLIIQHCDRHVKIDK